MFGNPCGNQIMSLALDAAVSGADASSSFAMEVASLELPLVDTVSLFAMVVDAAEAFLLSCALTVAGAAPAAMAMVGADTPSSCCKILC